MGQCSFDSTKIARWGRYNGDYRTLQTHEKKNEDMCSWNAAYEQSIECQRIYQLDRIPICMNDQNQPPQNEKINCPNSSIFEISSKETYAQTAVWSYCTWCSYSKSMFQLYDPDGRSGAAKNSPIMLTNERILVGQLFGELVSAVFSLDRCDIIVDKPAFIFPVNWQVGHLLVDGLEPLYHTMMDAFGKIMKDVYLFIQPVIMDDSEPYRFKRMMEDVQADTPFALLKNFTDHPIYTTGALNNIKGKLCFTKGLFLGLNLTYGYYAHGYDMLPLVADLRRERDKEIASKYKNFKRFVLSNLGLYGQQRSSVFDLPRIQQDESLFSSSPRSEIINITYIQRSKLRVLLNEQDVLSVVQDAALEVLGDRYGKLVVAQLERMTFTKQVDLFKHTSILISQWGTATHNVLFLAPGSVLILLVQQGYCHLAWIYVNQAIFSGVHVYLLCKEQPPSCFSQFRWIRKGWMSGPDTRNSNNWTVDIDMFQRMMPDVLSAVKTLPPWHGNSTVSFANYTQDRLQNEELALCDACCQESSSDLPAWVYLEMPVENKKPISHVHAMIATSVMPQDLMSRYPALAVCVRFLDSQSQPVCMDQEKTSILLSPFKIPASITNTSILISWLRDERTGKDFEESSSVLPIFPTEDQPYFYNITFLSKYGTLAFDVVFQTQVVPFVASVRRPGGLQRCIFCFCSDQPLVLSLEDCAANVASLVHGVLQEQYFLQAKFLPFRQHIPHIDNPFVYLDIGTSQSEIFIRSISKGVEQRSWKSLFSNDELCLRESPTSCSKVNPGSPKQRLEVIAGKFQWNIWKELLKVDTEDVSCLMILQHPVSKFILDYKRNFNETTTKSIDELDAEELKMLLFKNKESLNPVCKALCGSQSWSERENTGDRDSDQGYFSDHCNFSTAQERIGNCVVGISEYWKETAAMIEFWFPWITVDLASENGIEAQHTLMTLDLSIKKIIKATHYCDVQLFKYGLMRFQEQQLHILGFG